VAGTAAADAGGRVVGRGDIYRQSVFAIQKIGQALAELGCSLEDVVRTRVYTTDITRWKEIAKAHKEFFGRALPVNTTVQVSRFIDPEMLVEIEVEAIAKSGSRR